MRSFLVLAALAQCVFGGGVSQFAVRMPFLNPAGVTYINGPAPAGLAAGPLQYPGPLQYAAHPAPLQYAAHAAPLQYAAPAPLQYGYAPQAYAHQAYAHQPLAYAAPAYAHAKIPTVHAVPTVHHVPGVADVPYTRVVQQQGVVQKLVDVAKPAVSTRKFQLRRPAIQKQFYDIEERVVVRNAGSALLELDEPLSKIQQGPAVIQPVVHQHLVHAPVAVHHPLTPVAPIAPAPLAPLPVPVAPLGPFPAPFAPVPAAGPAPAFPGPFPAPAGPTQDDDSVVVENLEARSRSSPARQRLEEQRQMLDNQQQELSARQQQLTQEIQQEMQYSSRVQQRQFEQRQQPQQQQQFEQQQFEQRQQPQQQQQPEQRQQPEQQQQPEQRQQPAPQAPEQLFRGSVDIRPNGAPFDLVPRALPGPDVVPSLRQAPEINQANQQRLIQLLTARGGVAEVGFGRSGPAGPAVGDAGNVRARVLSATPAPEYAAAAGERVNTRRVVVSRPIETLQEIDVVEPVTKVHRIAVNQPTFFNTLQHEVARVPTSVPVYGKTLHHSYAHAAVPLQYLQH